MRVLTKEHKEKLKAGREARKMKSGKQKIEINKVWSIIRLDSMNWRILENGKLPGNRPNYYGTLLGAFMDLPEKVVKTAVENKNDSGMIYNVLKGLREDILKAISNL